MIPAPRQLFLLMFAASLAVLLGAYGFQYIGGLAPCKLCLYQRIPYALVILISGGAILWPASARLAHGALIVIFAVSAGLGVHHAGVEWHWWAGPASCSNLLGGAANIEELTAMILAAPVVRCDEVPWSLFGISLAGYNALISLALMCIGGFYWKRFYGGK